MSGVHFAVWAPNAHRVSVIGDFNHWDGRVHVMRRLVTSGIWEIFIPDLTDGACYKFEIRTHAGHLLQKADPYARRFEVPPNTASVVWTEGSYEWRDHDWLRDRESFGGWHDRPQAVYESTSGRGAGPGWGTHRTYAAGAHAVLRARHGLRTSSDAGDGTSVSARGETGVGSRADSRFGRRPISVLHDRSTHGRRNPRLVNGHFPKKRRTRALRRTALYENGTAQGEIRTGAADLQYGSSECALRSATRVGDEHIDGRGDAVARRYT